MRRSPPPELQIGRNSEARPALRTREHFQNSPRNRRSIGTPGRNTASARWSSGISMTTVWRGKNLTPGSLRRIVRRPRPLIGSGEFIVRAWAITELDRAPGFTIAAYRTEDALLRRERARWRAPTARWRRSWTSSIWRRATSRRRWTDQRPAGAPWTTASTCRSSWSASRTAVPRDRRAEAATRRSPTSPRITGETRLWTRRGRSRCASGSSPRLSGRSRAPPPPADSVWSTSSRRATRAGLRASNRRRREPRRFMKT